MAAMVFFPDYKRSGVRERGEKLLDSQQEQRAGESVAELRPHLTI
jgi:hypothetical protein